jgi:hypothetical protein
LHKTDLRVVLDNVLHNRVFPYLLMALSAAFACLWVQSDFMTFMIGGRMTAEGMGRHLYDPVVFLNMQSAWYGVRTISLLYLNPPFFALMMVPLSLLSHVLAAFIWWLLSALTAWAGLSLALRMAKLDGRERRAFLVLFWGAWPALYALMMGQNSMFSLVLPLWAVCLLEKRKDVGAGIVLSMALFKPHLAWLYPIFLLALGRWRAFVGYVAGASGLYLISSAVSGFDWPAKMLGLIAGGLYVEGHEVLLPAMQSPVAALRVLLGNRVGPFTLACLAGLVSTYVLVRRGRSSHDVRMLSGLTMLLMLAASPHLFMQDLVLLTWPLLLLYLRVKEGHVPARSFKALLALLYAVTYTSHIVAYFLPVQLTGAIILYLVVLFCRMPPLVLHQPRAPGTTPSPPVR